MGKTIKLKNDTYIANDLYSAEEKNIGKWIDGKTIYRKVLKGTLNSTGSQIIEQSLNIDALVNAGGYALGTVGNHRFMLNAFQGETSNLLRLFYNGNNRSFMVQFGSIFYNKKYEFWVEYTKITD